MSVDSLLQTPYSCPCPPLVNLVLSPLLPFATQVSGAVYSGSTGYQIGHRGSLGVDGDGVALLHVTRTGAQYILLPCGTLDATFLGCWAGLGLEKEAYKETGDWPPCGHSCS